MRIEGDGLPDRLLKAVARIPPAPEGRAKLGCLVAIHDPERPHPDGAFKAFGLKKAVDSKVKPAGGVTPIAGDYEFLAIIHGRGKPHD